MKLTTKLLIFSVIVIVIMSISGCYRETNINVSDESSSLMISEEQEKSSEIESAVINSESSSPVLVSSDFTSETTQSELTVSPTKTVSSSDYASKSLSATNAPTKAPAATKAPTATITPTPTKPVVHSIGDLYGGGLIAYILLPEDPGYDSKVQHGLIVSGIDLKGSEEKIHWSKSTFGSVAVPGGTSTAFGSGLENTKRIYAQNGPGNYAAGLAYAYRGGDNSDWYLPSKDELNKLYMNRIKIGGFSLTSYWSSSELSASLAILQSFGASGDWFSNYKDGGSYSVRAVRSF